MIDDWKDLSKEHIELLRDCVETVMHEIDEGRMGSSEDWEVDERQKYQALYEFLDTMI